MTTTHDAALLAIHAARVVAADRQPYLSSALFAMVPVPVPGLGTLASDARWRLYYDPAVATTWPVEELAGVLLHEVGHCLREHATRFQALGAPAGDADLFNIAGDVLINADLREDGIPLPAGALYPASLASRGITVGAATSAEQIYAALRDQRHAQPPQDGPGAPGDPEPGTGTGTGEQSAPAPGGGAGEQQQEREGWDCGSAADGVTRAYETHGDDLDPGIDPDRADLIRSQVAADIAAHARSHGHVPAGYQRWADSVLDPVVDWRRELASLVRRAYAHVAGVRDYTYARPSRRQHGLPRTGTQIVLPAMRQPAPPRVAIVIDTSGSMGNDMLAWALAETRGVLRALGSSGRQIQVITCDAAAVTQRVTDISQVQLLGGGGIDMRVGIDAALAAPGGRPHVVIVLTDGLTGWPDAPLPGVALIAALTTDVAADRVPAWARTVLVTPEQAGGPRG